MKKLLYTILALIVILVLGYTIFLNLPKASTKNKETKIEVTAVKLFKDFNRNEQNANNRYNGKVIEVSGAIRNVSKDKKGATVVLLNTDDMIGSVLCTFETPPESKLTDGQEVTIKGQCSGLLMDVVLNKCNLVK